jgi:hypothetical protein
MIKTPPPADQSFEVAVDDDIVHLITRGRPTTNDLYEPADAAIALADKKRVDKLLDDIRGVDSSWVDLPVQAKAMGVIWKLRRFKKVAIILKSESELRQLLMDALGALRISSQIRAFDDEKSARKWLAD